MDRKISSCAWLAALMLAAAPAAAETSSDAAFSERVSGGLQEIHSKFGEADAAPAVPPAVPRASARTVGRTVSFLTYNAGLLRVKLPSWLQGGDKVPHVAERAEILPGKLADFAAANGIDVIMLQEVWEDSHARDFSGALEAAGYAVVRPKNLRLGMGTGLLLAVRRPFELARWKFLPFSASAGAEKLAWKGTIAAVIRGPDGVPFALLGTHMQAMFTDRGRPIHEGEVWAHARQAAQINALVEEWSLQGALPTILLGDFNVGPGFIDANYRRIGETCRLRNAYPAMHPEGGITWDAENPLVRGGLFPNDPSCLIDHVFFRDGRAAGFEPLDARIVLSEPQDLGSERTPLSDHYGLAVRVLLADPQGTREQPALAASYSAR